jgi:ankyrin repeat protein
MKTKPFSLIPRATSIPRANAASERVRNRISLTPRFSGVNLTRLKQKPFQRFVIPTRLKLGAWSFSGAWSLGFGICVLLSTLPPALASTNLSLTLQQALFEEEANHNLPAAIQSYQALIAQHDQDRKLAATAVFRLGECYRKQGNVKDAAAQYERVIRDFSDQSSLVSLSRENLASLGVRPQTQPIASDAARQEQKRLLQEQIKLVEQQLAYRQKMVEVGRIPPDELVPTQIEILKLRGQLAAIDSGAPLNAGTDSTAAANDAERIALENRIAELKALPREKLRVAIQQSFPNPVLNSLMEQLIVAEQRLATSKQEYGPEHAEVLKAKTQLETVSKQLDTQVDAAVEALEIKRSALAAASQASSPGPLAGASTSPEAEEERRIKALIKDSPDLINASSVVGPNGESQTLLQAAAGKGQLSIVKLLLDNGAAVNGVRQLATTPLHYAAFNGHKAVVDFLLSKGANADAQTEQGVTPLHLAALKGYEHVAASLLKAGAPVNARVKSSTTILGYSFSAGETPIQSAASAGYPAVVQTLLASGADPNAINNDGRTPISYSVARGDENITKILLAADADPNAGRNAFPLGEAARKGDAALLELLLSNGANPNTNSNNSVRPLYGAIANRQAQAITILTRHKANLNILNPQGNPVIFDALGDAESLKALLDGGADPNQLSENRFGSMSESSSPLLKAVSDHNKAAVELLLTHHADPNLGYVKGGWTPLHSAAAYGDKEIAELLLKNGGKINARDSEGATPLHVAVKNGKTEMVQLLLAAKADPNARNNSGQTPLDLAKQFNAPHQPGALTMPTPLNSIPVRPLPATATTFASTGTESPPLKIADLLRQHGADDNLPDFSVIRVMRKGMGPWVIFHRDTNSFNRFSLFETLATAAHLNLTYPDFDRLRIHHPDPAKPGAQKEIPIDAKSDPRGLFDCAKDVPLEFGDTVEIPEREHTLTEASNYLTDPLQKSLQLCLKRRVKFVVRDQTDELTLEGFQSDAFLSQVLRRPTAQNLLRSSSDFSHVHVKRTDPESKKVTELTCDVQSIWSGKSPPANDLWLRNGDIIEVPDKSE